MELCVPTANKEVHFSLVECSNTPVVIKQERQVGSRVVALVLYSVSSVFKDTERCIRQKGSHCSYENLLLSLLQSKCIRILSDSKKKHEQRRSHPSFLSVTTTDTTTSSSREG